MAASVLSDIFGTDGHERAWMVKAACASVPTEIFYPPIGKESLALEVCASCPVSKECLDYAMDLEGSATIDDRHGIFGGLTPKQRTSEYRRRYPTRRVRSRSA